MFKYFTLIFSILILLISSNEISFHMSHFWKIPESISSFSSLSNNNYSKISLDLNKSIVTTIKSDSLNQAAKRPPKTGFVLDKAIKDLGYSPCTFEEGLAILDHQLKSM